MSDKLNTTDADFWASLNILSNLRAAVIVRREIPTWSNNPDQKRVGVGRCQNGDKRGSENLQKRQFGAYLWTECQKGPDPPPFRDSTPGKMGF